MSKLQLTLAIFKPDISKNEKAVSVSWFLFLKQNKTKNSLNINLNFKAIRNIILENKFLFIRTKFTKLTLDQAKEFYKVHESKFNFN